MKFQKLRGMDDILPPEVERWQEIEKSSRELFKSFGYQEIRTPIIEALGLFQRSIGETTDIVEKEIFQFRDKGGRELCLRPEATASIVRAYIEHNLHQKRGLLKLYYLGPMFRAERPQKGRKRQFHQIGIEAIGSYNPEVDVEIIYLCKLLLDKIGIKNFKIEINTLGCKKDKEKISFYLKEKIKKHINEFCQECQKRFRKNVLRMMDCKQVQCQENLRKFKVDIKGVICKNCIQHYEEVKDLLASLKLDYYENRYLVRGLDYYTRTVFEVLSPNLGAQNAVGAGGRYDNLIQEMGGNPTGAVGFALGSERILFLLSDKKIAPHFPEIFLVLQNRVYLKEALKLMMELRENGIYVEMDYQGRSLKSQMRLANEKGAKFVLILGKDEWERRKFTLKDMQTGRQIEVRRQDLIRVIKRR